MPSIETACRFQKAVLYVANGFAADGEETVAAGVSIDVRVEIGKREALDATGNVIAVDMVLVVDRAIPIGSIVWIGNINNIASPPVDLLEVKTYREVPDVKGRNFRRVIDLMRHSNTLPDIT
jgi:hypothetical protein